VYPVHFSRTRTTIASVIACSFNNVIYSSGWRKKEKVNANDNETRGKQRAETNSTKGERCSSVDSTLLLTPNPNPPRTLTAEISWRSWTISSCPLLVDTSALCSFSALFDCGKSYANCWAGKGCKILLGIHTADEPGQICGGSAGGMGLFCSFSSLLVTGGPHYGLNFQKKLWFKRENTKTTTTGRWIYCREYKMLWPSGKGPQKKKRRKRKSKGLSGGVSPVGGTRTKTVICTWLSYVPNQLSNGWCWNIRGVVKRGLGGDLTEGATHFRGHTTGHCSWA